MAGVVDRPVDELSYQTITVIASVSEAILWNYFVATFLAMTCDL
jgi:hypothetical protein